MHKQHYPSIDHELGVEVTTGVPFGWANSVFVCVVIDVEMGVVAFPCLVESVVNVFEELLICDQYDNDMYSIPF
jgi:hypothetical protein